MRSARFAGYFFILLTLVLPAAASTPGILCQYELGDVAYQRKPLGIWRTLAGTPARKLDDDVEALPAITLLRYAHDIAQTINERPGEEPGLAPLAIHLAKLAGNKAESREDRHELLNWLLRRAESMPQAWEKQFLINEIVDAAAGLDTRKVDEQVMGLSDAEVARRFGNEQTWFRFGNRDLLTPYFEFINILRKLNPQPGQRIVLLGSGVGREAIPTALQYPGVEVKGYEIVSERVKASETLRKKLALPHVEFHEQNLAEKSFKPEPADIYYAFNPVSGTTFDKILTDLKENAEKHERPFHIVVSGPAPYEKFTRDGSGFIEVTPPERFADDNFARYFHYSPGSARERSLSSIGKPEKRAASLPQFPDLGEFSAADRAWIEPALKEHPSNFSHVHYPTLFTWQSVDKVHTTQILGLPTLVRIDGAQKVYLEPLSGSPKEKAAAIRFAILATRPGEEPPKFEYVSEEVANALPKSGITISPMPDRADYVYYTGTLANLEHDDRQTTTGIDRKRLREKREQARRFHELNPSAKYLAFKKTDTETFERVNQFLDSWKKGRMERLGNEGLNEIRATRSMLEHMDELGFEGRYVEVDGRIIAFSLGQKNKDDTFTIYAQKADPGAGPHAAGVYPYFFREQAKELLGRGVPYINLQSDEGVAGLRQMKKSLGPKELVMAYEVIK